RSGTCSWVCHRSYSGSRERAMSFHSARKALPASATALSRRKGLAREPAPSLCVQGFDLGADEAGHVPLDVVADAGLQVRKVPVAVGKSAEELGIECELRRRIDRIEPVLFVDRLAQHEAPAAA